MNDTNGLSGRSPKPNGGRPVAGILVLSIVVLIGAGLSWWGLTAAFSGGAPATPAPSAVASGTSTGTATEIGITPVPTKTASDQRWAFLLLGYGGEGHDGGYLTDSIMVAIMDPAKKSVTLLSLPRDSWVPLLLDGKTPMYDKVNAAYADGKETTLYPGRLSRYTGGSGAGNFTKDTISRLLGIPITNFMALDFAGFREMIDTMGGIDVEVPSTFTAAYPANDNPSIDASWTTVTFTAGKEHMDGERAIRFARAREAIDNMSEGTDFARSRRQRIIMEAFKDKLFQPGGMIHIPQILSTARDHVDTDYGITDIGQVTSFITSWKDVHFTQSAISTANYLIEGTGPGGAYVLVPSTPDRSWSQIRAFAKRLWDNPDAGAAMANTKITVVNSTGQPGVGEHVTQVLASFGYLVEAPQTGETLPDSGVIDGTGGKATPVIKLLEKDLGTTLPPATGSAVAAGDGLVIQIGSNDAGLIDLALAKDDSAPVSDYGVDASSGWSPAGQATTPEPVATEENTNPDWNATSEPTPSAAVTETPQAGGNGDVGTTPEPVVTPTTEAQPTETATAEATEAATAEPTSEATPDNALSPTPTAVPWPTPETTATP
jgi:polyisoprenyl-teichoic acid--peptidoglycan teichoic acid transferase